MCPACMAAAALTAAKVASVGGLTAYGVKKLVDKTLRANAAKDLPDPPEPVSPMDGVSYEEDPRRVR